MNETVRDQRDPDEIEIDIRKYLERLWRGRLIIISLAVVGAILGGLLSLAFPPGYEAIAGIAIVKSRTDIEFDPRVKTLSPDDLATTSADARRNALLTLVNSGQVAQQVLTEVGPQLSPDDRTPAKLLRTVKAELAQRSDFILIRVQHKDPQVAADIANVWAGRYEQFVNGIYASGQPSYASSVNTEVQQSRDAYEQSQKALESFLADNQVSVLRRQISDTQQIIGSLSSQRLASLTAIVNKRLNARTAIVEQYLDAQTLASSSVLSEAAQSQITLLTDYYATQADLEQLVEATRALRNQTANGGPASSRSNSLAIVLLKARAFAGTNELPGSLQVTLGGVSDLQQTTEDQVKDLDALVTVLEARQKFVAEQVSQLSANLSLGKGFALPTTNDENTPLQQAAAEQAVNLFTLKGIESLVPESALSSDAALATLIDQYALKLNKAQSQLEAEEARKKDLTEQRDLNRDAYTTILKKQNEVRIAGTLSGSEVRFASSAVVPDQRVTSRFVPIAVGLAVGLLIGFVIALIRGATGDGARSIGKAAKNFVNL
jgi:uncharacterized protein involved in exopolysaccharide biosynthesis